MDAIIANETRDEFRIQETVNNTLQLMKNLTSPNSGISAGDLSSSLDVLEKIVTVTNATGSVIEKEVNYYNYPNYIPTFPSNLQTLLISVRLKKIFLKSQQKGFPRYQLCLNDLVQLLSVKELMIVQCTFICFLSMQQNLKTVELHVSLALIRSQ